MGQDAETGEVHFMDGRTVQGDLVIGADGLHVSKAHFPRGQKPP